MTDPSVTEPILQAENTENETARDERNGNVPNGLERVNDADVMFMESFKKKNEERKKALKTIYMSYDKLSMQTDDDAKLFDNSSEDVGSPKGSKIERLNDAIMSLDYAAVLSLLEQGAGVDLPNRFGRCPLHTAILKGDHKMVKMILEAYADVTLKDDRGDTPLHYAVRSGNELITKELLKYSECDVNAKDNNGSTPLHVAASLNKNKLCKLLLEHSANFESRDVFGKTPLGRAMESGASKSAKFLLEYITQNNMDVDSYLYNADKDGSTLLHLAVDSGFVKMVNLCLKYGSVVRQPKEKDRSTAFHLACEQGSVDIAKVLLQQDPGVARIFLIDASGSTPLHNAAKNNSHYLIELLVNHGANVNAKDVNNVTPLMLAASFGATDSVELLLSKGADATIKNIDGRTVLFYAVGHGNVMEILLADEQLIPLMIEIDAVGFAPPHYAAKRGDVKSMRLFLAKNKGTANVLSDALVSPLHVASRHGKHEIVSVLLEKQAGKIINLQDTRARTALHYAASGGHHRVVAKLLSYGAVIERDHNDRTALHEAARKGSKKTVELIIENRIECINLKDDECNTALHLAAIYQHPDLVTVLLNQSVQEIYLNSSKQTILNIALDMNNHDVTEAIVQHERWRQVLTAGSNDVTKQMMTIIEKMPHLAERLLDNCTQKEGNPFEKKYKVKYDLSLILGNQKTAEKGSSLKVLKSMVEHRRDRCLTHPLCFIVLSTKWKKFGCYAFLLNLFMFMAFLIPLTYLHTMLEDSDEKYCARRYLNKTDDGVIIWDTDDKTCFMYHPVLQGLQYFIIASGFIQLIKEFVQFYHQRMRYITSFSSWLDVIGVGAALISVIPPCECKWGMQKEFAAFAIFLCWINLIMYFRRLPFYGKYVIMLYCMFVTLLKVLVLFVFFIIAFGTTFHIILDKEPFTSVPTILMNMFIMTLGEMNYTDVFMPWSDLYYPTLVNILMIMFCLTMPIIMMNMLVGLAVGDIDKIEKNALIDRYIMQVELLIDLESALPSWILRKFHFTSVVDYPNAEHSIFTKIYDVLIGFGTGNDEDEKPDDAEESPEILKIHEKLEEQAAEIDEIHRTVTTILELLRAQKEAMEMPQKKDDSIDNKLTQIKGIPPLDFLGSLTSTAFSFGKSKADDTPSEDMPP